MKPARCILDLSFRYVPATATSVTETWRRFGWRPTTEEERDRRRRSAAPLAGHQPPRLVVPRLLASES